MAGSKNDVTVAKNADFSQAGAPNATSGEANGLITNGQLWIGSTAINAGSTHINVGTLTSPSGTLSIGYSSPNITVDLSGGSVGVDSFATQGGTSPVFPTAAGLVNLSGNNVANDGYAAWSVGSANTVTINSYGHSRWVVNSVAGLGTHTTIASALTSASSGDDIFITPGTYTENLTLKAGVNLIAYLGDQLTPSVTIIGKLSYSSAGSVSISNIKLQTNSDNFLAITGSAASIVYLDNCYLNCSNNTGISYTTSNVSAALYVMNCSGNIATNGTTMFTCTGNGFILFTYCYLVNTGNSSTASSSSGAAMYFDWSNISFPVSCSSGSTIIANFSIIDSSPSNTTAITTAGTETSTISQCEIVSGTASAISIGAGTTVKAITNRIECSNTNAVTGAGTFKGGANTFSGTSSLVNTTTQNPWVLSNDAVTIKTPSAYPYTTVPQDAVILVDTSSARTIIPLASPTTGQRHIIKDNVGSAGTNNITVTPSGKNIDGAASYVISTNYGSICIVYNGTQWNVTSQETQNMLVSTLSSGSGNWTANPLTKYVRVMMWGGGGGGGSGRKGTSASSSGGGGGGGGQSWLLEGPVSVFSGSIAYSVGGAANGGAAQTADANNGSPGTIGNNTVFGSAIALGGNLGSAGTGAAGAAGAGRSNNGNFYLLAGLGGGNGATTTGQNAASAGGPTQVVSSSAGGGGGSGGDLVTPRQAGTGGGLLDSASSNLVAPASGGIASGTIDGSGGSTAYATGGIIGGGMGGGGGGGATTGSPTAGMGGDGSAPGGGGGGGGGGINTVADSGKGGNGAAGKIIIYEFF